MAGKVKENTVWVLVVHWKSKRSCGSSVPLSHYALLEQSETSQGHSLSDKQSK